MKHIAIVLAAGQGKRMNSKVAKQYLLLEDKPVLFYSLKVFEDSFVDHVIVVAGEEAVAYCQKEIVEKYGFTKVSCVAPGGRERYHSVNNGLLAAARLAGQEETVVYIHDGARPFVSQEMLLRLRESVEAYGTGVAGMPVKDTIKIVDGAGFALETPNRSYVWQVQTPQCFLYADIAPAYAHLIAHEREILEKGISITDDAMVMELLGCRKVKMVPGSYENMKITTPEDLTVARSFMEKSH